MANPEGNELTRAHHLEAAAPPRKAENQSIEPEMDPSQANGAAPFGRQTVGGGYVRVKLAEKDTLGFSGRDPERGAPVGCWLPLSRTQTALAAAGVCLLVLVVIAFGTGLGGKHVPKSTEYGQLGELSQCVRAPKGGEKPTLILISSDGFRWDYLFKVPTPNIDRLRTQGTETATGMMPMYPSITFPNHYSIVTGLHPESHGIIANYFRPADNTSEQFSMANHDARWWLGEPMWVTARRQGLTAAAYFWPGAEVVKPDWPCDPDYCPRYNSAVPYEDRVDRVLGWLDLPPEQRPQFMTMYMEDPDHWGHRVGPDAPQIDAAVTRVDAMIGRLLDGLETRGILNTTHVIMVGDHGMTSVCECKDIYLEDLAPWVDLPLDWVNTESPVLSLLPPPEVDVRALHANISRALAPGGISNGEFLSVYLKEDIPERFHYSHSARIAPIVGIVAEGYTVRKTRAEKGGIQCGGVHGFDNALFSMRTIFFGRGPRFGVKHVVPSFHNIELYEVMCDILGLEPAPNNGTAGFKETVLRRSC